MQSWGAVKEKAHSLLFRSCWDTHAEDGNNPVCLGFGWFDRSVTCTGTEMADKCDRLESLSLEQFFYTDR